MEQLNKLLPKFYNDSTSVSTNVKHVAYLLNKQPSLLQSIAPYFNSHLSLLDYDALHAFLQLSTRLSSSKSTSFLLYLIFNFLNSSSSSAASSSLLPAD